MPTQRQVRISLELGADYEEVGRRWGVPPGQAYLIATGLPADGSDSLAPEDLDRPGLLPGSSQHLSNPPHENPTRKEHVLEWVRRRALADTQMQAASRRRTAEPGAPVGADDDHDVLSVLRRDHTQIEALLQQLETLPGVKKGGTPADLSTRQSIVDMVSEAVSRHEAAEEEYFWPHVGKVLPDGKQRVRQATAQEQEGAETLNALGGTEPDDERFDDLVEELVLRLRKHVAFEDEIFLEVRRVVSGADRRTWGETILRAEKRAVTRPHPHTPRSSATAVKAAGAVGAGLDRVRDATGRPADRKGRPTEAAAADSPEGYEA